MLCLKSWQNIQRLAQVLRDKTEKKLIKPRPQQNLSALLFLSSIYLVIALTFRSFSQSLMLIIMIPFSMIGVVIGHYLHGFPVNILSWLGIIALIGIMVNDGLVLVDKFNSNLRDGLKFNDALF